MKIGKEPAHGHTNVIHSIPEFTQQFESKIGRKKKLGTIKTRNKASRDDSHNIRRCKLANEVEESERKQKKD